MVARSVTSSSPLSWASSDSRSASRRDSSDSTCTTSPIVLACASSTRIRSTLRCWVRTRLSTSMTWLVTSSALRWRSSSFPSRPRASSVAPKAAGGTRSVRVASPYRGRRGSVAVCSAPTTPSAPVASASARSAARPMSLTRTLIEPR